MKAKYVIIIIGVFVALLSILFLLADKSGPTGFAVFEEPSNTQPNGQEAVDYVIDEVEFFEDEIVGCEVDPKLGNLEFDGVKRAYRGFHVAYQGFIYTPDGPYSNQRIDFYCDDIKTSGSTDENGFFYIEDLCDDGEFTSVKISYNCLEYSSTEIQVFELESGGPGDRTTELQFSVADSDEMMDMNPGIVVSNDGDGNGDDNPGIVVSNGGGDIPDVPEFGNSYLVLVALLGFLIIYRKRL